MILDKLNTFAGAPAAPGVNTGWVGVAIPVAVGTTVIGDVIDTWLGNAAKPNINGPVGPNGELGGPLSFIPDPGGTGAGGEAQLWAQLGTILTTGAGATCKIELVACSQANLAGGTVVVLRSTETLGAVASWAAGTVLRALNGPIPPALQNLQYLGLRVIITTAVNTAAGTLIAGLTRDFQQGPN